MIPRGISQCPVHIKPDWLQEQLGVPVVEAIGAPIRMAGLLAGLGLKQSRVRWPGSQNLLNFGVTLSQCEGSCSDKVQRSRFKVQRSKTLSSTLNLELLDGKEMRRP